MMPPSVHTRANSSDKSFYNERSSGHQGMEGKAREPGRLRGMQTPVAFAGTSGRGQEEEKIDCRPPPP